MRDTIELLSFLDNANVKAFLAVIRAGEGTADEDGYRRHFGGRLFDSFADHPRVAITAGLGKNQYTSTAAGAYQFLERTWDSLVKRYGFADFAPRTQDIAAIALIDGRKALDDVLAGRFQQAVRKCNREWASLPESPYGQPTRTMAQAEEVYREHGGLLIPQDGSVLAAWHEPAAPTPTPAPVESREISPQADSVTTSPNADKPEPAMAFPLLPLAGLLVNVFAPLVREKVNKEMSRHTDSPQVAEQIAQSVVTAAQAVTGIADPLEAVVAAKANPEMVQAVQTSVLDDLAKMAPLLDKIAEWDKAAWQAEEASRDAASARAANDPHDQDQFLTRAIVALLVGLLIAIGALIAAMTYLKADAGTIGTLVGLFAATGGVIVGKFGTRYDHRYGSSRSSGAKDVTIGQLARRP